VESDEFEWRTLQEQKSLRSLILIGNLKIRSSDSLNTFASLRTLHIESSKFSHFVDNLYQLKHLRYLTLRKCYDINNLPENIHKMKFLQHICLEGCENFVKLPNSIVMLSELRYLCLEDTCINIVPKGFHALTNLRTLHGFLAQMDGDWCSLEELGSLSNLKVILLVGLGDLSSASFASKARLSKKLYLSVLGLYCSHRTSDEGLVTDGISEKDQGIIKEVFDELCPPPCIEDIIIQGYFGRQLPRWMMSTSEIHFVSLRTLMMWSLVSCTQLPDGLSQLPCLVFLQVRRAPAIKRVGPEFLRPDSHCHHSSSQVVVAFPRMNNIALEGMVQWEEWEWEEEVQAMPALEELRIEDCKLRCIPRGLSVHASFLKKLTIWNVEGLQSLENFASVVELKLYDIPYLTKISNFPKLQKLEILFCPNIESVQEMTALRRLRLRFFNSERQLPLYLHTVNPSHLLLDHCSPKLLASMVAGKSGSEWDKFSHIQHVEAYADDGDIQKKWHLFYTSEPYSMEANIEPNLEVICTVNMLLFSSICS
jgi:Leucine-rich repeat (LRR) protein